MIYGGNRFQYHHHNESRHRKLNSGLLGGKPASNRLNYGRFFISILNSCYFTFNLSYDSDRGKGRGTTSSPDPNSSR
jgi:hypothetical protein